MNIALMSHDNKKELMVQFCTAYAGILSKHHIYATNTTGHMVADATGLKVHCFLTYAHGGSQQIGARITYDEIDMVINIGWVKDQRWDEVLAEIKAIKASCQGRILKVIVETCLLTEAEKIKLCELVTESGADYIKTSTGFSTGGATREDVALFKAHIGPGVKIKAAGGISSLQDAEDFMALGADRLGTSRIVKLVKGEHAEGY